jgi:hypothetical protein
MIKYTRSYIDDLAQISSLFNRKLIIISILGFAISNLQCSAKPPVLLMNQQKSLVLNQSYLPTLYTVTASFNDQGPLRIMIHCKSKTTKLNGDAVSHLNKATHKEDKKYKENTENKNKNIYTNDIHSTLRTHRWYTLAQLQKNQIIKIKRSVVHSLALPIKSDLQGIQWAYIKKVQIDGLIFKDMMWQVKASNELPATVDAQISCRNLIESMGSTEIVVRHQVEQGKISFWHTSSISSIKIKNDKPIKTTQLKPKVSYTHLSSSQNFSTRMQSNEHLERFNSIWSFKRSYSHTHIAIVAQYQHASILGTRHGKIALGLMPYHLGQRISKKENDLRIQWRTPRNKLPKDLWFLVNLSKSIDQPFYVRVHINTDQPSQSWVSSKWPKSQIINPIDPGSHIKVLDVLRGPWKCTHAVCLAEVPLATIRAIKESL